MNEENNEEPDEYELESPIEPTPFILQDEQTSQHGGAEQKASVSNPSKTGWALKTLNVYGYIIIGYVFLSITILSLSGIYLLFFVLIPSKPPSISRLSLLFGIFAISLLANFYILSVGNKLVKLKRRAIEGLVIILIVGGVVEYVRYSIWHDVKGSTLKLIITSSLLAAMTIPPIILGYLNWDKLSDSED